MVQGSRVLSALPEVPGFSASTHTAAHNHSGPRRYDALFWPPYNHEMHRHT